MQHNQFNGDNTGIVIQARDVHFAGPLPVEDTPLIRALHAATVEVTSTGTGLGVCVAPNLVLTAAELVPARYHLPRAPSLAVVSWPTAGLAFPVLHPDVPPESLRTTVDQVPGAPVLNRLTGAVCGIVTTAGPVFVPELGFPVDQRWLDLLSPPQLAAGGWRHLSPDLRECLRAVREQGNEHEYRFDGHSAPDLRSVFLTRWATPESESGGTEPPERVNAEELLTASTGAQVLGEAGMGKSSLVRYFAAVSAEAWLEHGTGQAVPVPVTAKALAREGGLPDLLARGVRSTTLAGQRLVDLFGDAPLPGVPWLVLVDGLDELIDTSAQYDLVQRVNRYRRDERYRFVLTSRHFGFGWFDQRSHPTYVLSRFGHQDLRQFISTWFREEDRSDDEAAELFTRLRSTELYELARVPLIATMLCLLSCAGEAAELPNDQTELYERYVHWQLQKVEHSDVRAKLLRWQARAGASAEQAADALLGKLRPVLQELAHASIDDDTGLLDLATARFPGLAPNAVREALLASGLVASGGKELVFRHETIREFLAACHLFKTASRPKRLLAPRLSRREWPDLKVKLFLAALVAKDGDLGGTLRRAMWWPYRRYHLEFLVGLVLHGVPVGARLRADLVRLLTAEVRSAWSTDEVWRRHVDWLRQIDRDAATWLLRDLVEQSNAVDEFRRFGAVVHLVEFDARANEPTLLAYLRSPRTAMIAFNSVRDLLAEVDPELGLRVFTDLATTAANSRLRSHAAMTVFGQDQAAGLRLLADLARSDEESDEIRREVIEFLDDRDSDLGLTLWQELMLTARAKSSRAHAADVCFQRDSEAAVHYFAARLHDDSTTPLLKFEVAQVLVHREVEDPVVLFDLADAELPVEDRLHVATRFGPEHPERAVALLLSLLSEPAARSRVLEVVKALQELSPERAVQASLVVAMDDRYRPSVRLDAAENLPRGMRPGVYERLAAIRSFSEDVRMKIAKKAFRIEAAVGLRIYDQLVRTAPDTAARTRVAVEARQVTGTQGMRFVEDLPARAQLDLLPQLNRSDAIRLLHRLATSGPTAQRLNAARKLVSVGGKREAAKAYQRIADSRSMSSSTREDAQAEADRLNGK